MSDVGSTPPTCMTYQKFLDALASTAVRPWDTTGTLLRVRDVGCQCPITAVCYKMTGLYYGLHETMAAAERIGLGRTIAQLIISAADNLDPLAHEELAVMKLRRDMRAALGGSP